ncbi:hypothetical protein ACMFMF_002040 [Clarireedia jacksonii]
MQMPHPSAPPPPHHPHPPPALSPSHEHHHHCAALTSWMGNRPPTIHIYWDNSLILTIRDEWTERESAVLVGDKHGDMGWGHGNVIFAGGGIGRAVRVGVGWEEGGKVSSGG